MRIRTGVIALLLSLTLCSLSLAQDRPVAIRSPAGAELPPAPRLAPAVAQCGDLLRDADGLVAAAEHRLLLVADEAVMRDLLRRAKDLLDETRELEAEEQHEAAAARAQEVIDLFQQ